MMVARSFSSIDLTRVNTALAKGTSDVMRLRLPFLYMICAATAWSASLEIAAGQAAREQPLTEFGEFNRHVEDVHRKGEGWTSSARTVALSFVGKDCECGNRTVFEQPSAGRHETTIIITDEGLHDDSMGAERYHLVLTTLPNGAWQIDRGTLSWSCRSGRGHRDFSAEMCQ
jgi:hypothetical protein